MILDDLYEAALDDVAFAALPTRLADAVGARSAAIFTFAPTREVRSVSFSYFTDEMVGHLFDEDLWRHDPWTRIAVNRGRPGLVLNCDDHLDSLQFSNSLFFHEAFKRFGDDTAHCAGTLFDVGQNACSIAIHRGHRAGAFSPREIDGLQRLLPHVRRVVEIRDRLSSANAQASAATRMLDRLSTPAMRLDAQGHVRFANASAERLLRTDDGIASVRGRVALADVAAQDRFDRAIKEACGLTGMRGGGLTAPCLSGVPDRKLIVAPAGPGFEG